MVVSVGRIFDFDELQFENSNPILGKLGESTEINRKFSSFYD
jgi:hypothetical protein